MNDLNTRLLAAHARGDRDALVSLYAEAADQAGSIDAACFFLTQAYVFALDQGHVLTGHLYQRLAEHGRV